MKSSLKFLALALLFSGITVISDGAGPWSPERSTLAARSRSNHLYTRRAIYPPRTNRPLAHQDHTDEIDQEIERYFGQVKSESHVYVGYNQFGRIFGQKSGARKAGARYKQNKKSASKSDKTGQSLDDNSQDNGLVTSHTVRKGDSINLIAREYSSRPRDVLKDNPFLKKRPLYIGEEILIVKMQRVKASTQRKVRYYTVRKGDYLSKIARKKGVSVKNLRRWNRLKKGQKLRRGQKLKVGASSKRVIPSGYKLSPVFKMPIRARITSRFGRRYNPFIKAYTSYHKGIDFGAAIGTPFYAARDGLVILARRMGGYGNCVFILHAGGYVTVYAHGKDLKLKRGELVKKGQLIGQVGRTGNATGPHLHFEIRKWKKAINPLAAMRMRELIPVAAKRKGADRTAYNN